VTYLPHVRIASGILQRDRNELKELMAGFVKVRLAPQMLEGLTNTKKHLEGLAKMIDQALFRSFLLLERLGYSPDNPPSDSQMN